jgi:hypothetical protein
MQGVTVVTPKPYSREVENKEPSRDEKAKFREIVFDCTDDFPMQD